jgi:hypothetical protein
MRVTFDGYEGGELVTPLINVWADWETREDIVAVVHHGATAELLSHEGMRCEVEVEDGARGFITFWFIKELKGDPAQKRVLGGDEIVTLRPVALDVLATFMGRLGLDGDAGVDHLLDLEGDEREAAEQEIERLISYCVKRGVVGGPKALRKKVRWLERLFDGPAGVLQEVVFPIMVLTTEVGGA